MDFPEKLQELRKSKNMTQEELAESLFVSRAAVSKWESGRGLPSIDSLKAISVLFKVSIDDLLSGDEVILAAQDETREKLQRLRATLFGLLDVMHLLFFFLPMFGEKTGDFVRAVSLLSLPASWIRTVYLVLFAFAALFGAVDILLQNMEHDRIHSIFLWTSVGFSLLITSFAILNRQPCISLFELWLLVVKAFFYLKQR